MHNFFFKLRKRYKEGCKKVIDNCRTGWPSTSRTEVNIEWARQVVNDASQLNMIKDSVCKIIT